MSPARRGGDADKFLSPLIGYGAGDWIHLSCKDWTLWGPVTVRQSRAANFANGGLPAWEAPVTFEAPPASTYLLAMEPSSTSGNVTVVLWESYLEVNVRSRYSDDFGATWPEGNVATLPFQPPALAYSNLPTGSMAVLAPSAASDVDTFEPALTRASVPPTIWTAPEAFSSHSQDGSSHCRLAYDATRANRFAAVWVYELGGFYHVRFDAEWRRDPGYPNTEVGFPIAVAGGGQTPPAVAEVDGDSEKEIVFGTKDGHIYVVDHDGAVAPGWPVDIGTLPYDAPVAVGDLLRDGNPIVVSGNEGGLVYAFDPKGALLPGWPYDMATNAGVYVSIGAVGPTPMRYVVAVSGTKMAILNLWGANVAPPWADIPFGTYMRPAAIGDIDNTGTDEIVSAAGPNIYIHRLGEVLFSGGHFAGEVFSDAPTLADINGDNELEVAAPTQSGKMYLLTNDLVNYSGSWPITVSPGVPLTSAAFGQILGASEPELVFAETSGAVHIRFHTGVEQTGYPLASGSDALFMPPMLAPVNITNSNVNTGTTVAGNAGTGHSWRNIPANAVPGWPRNLPGAVEETFASGDIDGDGRNEIVVLGVEFLTVFDVGTAPQADPRRQWPMYGYDAQRRGCLACVETATDVGDTPPFVGEAGLEIYPNPFNPVTTITYDIARPGRVTLAVYDVNGRLVETLINGEHRETGRYSISYRAELATGVYFVRLTTGGEEVARKMVLLK